MIKVKNASVVKYQQVTIENSKVQENSIIMELSFESIFNFIIED